MTLAPSKNFETFPVLGQPLLGSKPTLIDKETQHWLDDTLSGMSLSSHLFEIGSGDGRDADYIESQGFTVECSDAAQSYVTILLEKGYNARLHNAIWDPILGSYDLILAHAVLGLFKREETTLVVSKVFTALKKRGRFAFTVRKGSGEKWTTEKMNIPQYFHYWTRSEIETLLKNTGFSRWIIHECGGTFSKEEPWLQVIAFKDK